MSLCILKVHDKRKHQGYVCRNSNSVFITCPYIVKVLEAAIKNDYREMSFDNFFLVTIEARLLTCYKSGPIFPTAYSAFSLRSKSRGKLLQRRRPPLDD